MSIHPQVDEAIRIVEEHKHWLFKQAPEELDQAILTLVNFVKWKLDPKND